MKLQVLLLFSFMMLVANVAAGVKGARIQRKLLFDFWRSTPPKSILYQVLTFIKSRFADLILPQDQEMLLKTYLKRECEKIRFKWLRKQRRLDLFLNANEECLNEECFANSPQNQVTVLADQKGVQLQFQ